MSAPRSWRLISGLVGVAIVLIVLPYGLLPMIGGLVAGTDQHAGRRGPRLRAPLSWSACLATVLIALAVCSQVESRPQRVRVGADERGEEGGGENRRGDGTVKTRILGGHGRF
ncbi:hypothetical protein KQY30_33770 [Streptomyces sp. GMY02]|nr:hypothetical protein KQY30_33770 [Streptomyces sp. GMY02]